MQFKHIMMLMRNYLNPNGKTLELDEFKETLRSCFDHKFDLQTTILYGILKTRGSKRTNWLIDY